MRVLVTGVGGQLGKEWCRFLEKQKADFVAADSSELDITDKGAVENLFRKHNPGLVINCAAYTAVDNAEEQNEAAFRVNRDGVELLLNACLNSGAKLVHFSTDYVFPGRREDEEVYPDGYPEDAATYPVNLYGKSKKAGETVLYESNGEYLLIRVAWLCGPTGRNFVDTMLRLSENHDTVRVVDDQIGAPSFTFDVVEITQQLLDMGKDGVWHVRSDGRLSWADLAEETFRLAGKETSVERITTEQFPTKAKRPAFSLLGIDKLRNTGITPPQWRESLKRLLKLKTDQ
ncbi:MAG: dTDP-4-dehydrorhamnose reductase [Balneolaceae bacterium]|nr:dTDP-4-dehydrorhamnose reductase [Balneolaceae bacterium]MCH8548453.1 dTDP-4-dehydrorhamnose reductase [Balneolaceae bacterium]